MIFNVFLTGLLAATAAALPQPHRARSEGSAVETRGSDGGIKIVNNMGSDVYLWTTTSDSGSMKTLSSGGGHYSEDWTTNSNGGGISIKMSTSQDKDSVLQFEYTQHDDTLFWDMSSIDLDSSSEFIKSGFTAEPSDSSCRSSTCAAGDADCSEAYQKPDDVNTYSCSLSSGFTLTLG
ncbi:unnamed protein product [Penicillium salamii]|uniref:Uncharacterized protein n=1 Tax=Penicillium salamii TaxID=1612424 RepID=A0A9W4NJP0_9EURO|nr:unnamed protein product [Penicillium salamii]CAG8375487.1 unnamed protein product [Penicillium salamii]CAG8412992.1 unnamed protein product [Penicillium salamii]